MINYWTFVVLRGKAAQRAWKSIKELPLSFSFSFLWKSQLKKWKPETIGLSKNLYLLPLKRTRKSFDSRPFIQTACPVSTSSLSRKTVWEHGQTYQSFDVCASVLKIKIMEYVYILSKPRVRSGDHPNRPWKNIFVFQHIQ